MYQRKANIAEKILAVALVASLVVSLIRMLFKK